MDLTFRIPRKNLHSVRMMCLLGNQESTTSGLHQVRKVLIPVIQKWKKWQENKKMALFLLALNLSYMALFGKQRINFSISRLQKQIINGRFYQKEKGKRGTGIINGICYRHLCASYLVVPNHSFSCLSNWKWSR
ncbi:uncharacterized protein LOC141623381 isoform X1 [Silene latifolia]|uniref:uncharacterized protein LOC141623381 isoform X1 n=1 Tax=Silene latifolia TaxID=37657 RepID=UPI003D781AEE